MEELEEEAGLKCEKLELIGSFNPMTGATDEMCYVFLAHEVSPGTAKQGHGSIADRGAGHRQSGSRGVSRELSYSTNKW